MHCLVGKCMQARFCASSCSRTVNWHSGCHLRFRLPVVSSIMWSCERQSREFTDCDRCRDPSVAANFRTFRLNGQRYNIMVQKDVGVRLVWSFRNHSTNEGPDILRRYQLLVGPMCVCVCVTCNRMCEEVAITLESIVCVQHHSRVWETKYYGPIILFSEGRCRPINNYRRLSIGRTFADADLMAFAVKKYSVGDHRSSI